MLVRKLAAPLLVAASLIANVSVAKASTVYAYTGNPFTTGAPGSVSGEFTVATALGDNFNGAVIPTQFSFSSGALTLSSSGSPAYVFDIQTSSTGAILAWYIGISTGLASITTSNFNDSAGIGFIFGSDSFNPGTWSVSNPPSATPLPASWTMMLSVLVMGFGFSLYQKAKGESGARTIAIATA
jgi:hypothetical protein